MQFLKPTRSKIILTLILGIVLNLLVFYFGSSSGCSLQLMTVPTVPGQTPLPPPLTLTLSEIGMEITMSPLFPMGCYPIMDQYIELSLVLSTLLRFVITYLVVCIIIFFVSKLKKQHGK